MEKSMNSYLRWAGGKKNIKQIILSAIENIDHDVFFEPFCGALNIGANVNAHERLLSDSNSHLMITHMVVQNEPKKLIRALRVYFDLGYDSYYDIREQFNKRYADTTKRIKDPVDLAATFLYLNAHGFNGLCRYNSKGWYNTPIGKDGRRNANFPYDEIMDYHEKLQYGYDEYVELSTLDFESAFNVSEQEPYKSMKGLIYCDPPYVPITSNFNYSADGFGIEQQQKLAELAEKSSHSVIISNHDTEVTRELYKNASKIISFPVQRTISGKGTGRNKVNELIAIYKR